MKKDKKEVFIDPVELWTAIFILIVLYVHHAGYTSYYIFFNSPIPLNYLAVGGFFFLSAYKLTKSKMKDSFTGFWKNRLIRIYPIYFIALILFTIFVYKSFNLGNFIIHALALQILFPDLFGANYLTLYFIALLFMYYMIFSITKQYLNNLKKFLLISSLIFFVCLFVDWITSGLQIFEYRFFLYYPMFITGMIFSYYELQIKKNKYFNNISSLLVSIIIFIIVYIIKVSLDITDIYFEITANFYLIPFFLFIISTNFKKSNINMINSFIKKLAYASFCIYLFHRPIWQFLGDIWYERSIAQWFFIMFFGFALIYTISYFIQSKYDFLIGKSKKS